jgi:glutathione synthase/RimK-type ligase-like ATP-grasp enzyme
MISPRKVFIATLPNGFFGSSGISWKSLSPEKISEKIKKDGNDVIVTQIDKLQNITLEKNDIVIYTSSDEQHIRAYIKDLMYIISKKCTIIPSYDALLAHENKGFQQLFRNEHNFGNVDGGYTFDADSLPRKFPYVYKKTTGAGSSGVSLIKKEKDLKKIKSRDFRISLKRKAINLARKLKLTKNEFEIYYYRNKGFNLAVYQEFIEDLSCDYKVLVFAEKFFVLKRDVRKNDFRASGSGLFKFDTPPEELLEFSEEIFKKIDTPYASLDVAIKNNECKLIEYQALNFGPYTLVNSPGYFIKKNLVWTYIEMESDLEENFSNALSVYIRNIEITKNA